MPSIRLISQLEGTDIYYCKNRTTRSTSCRTQLGAPGWQHPAAPAVLSMPLELCSLQLTPHAAAPTHGNETSGLRQHSKQQQSY